MTTITTSTTIGVTLDPATYINPVLVAAGVTITNSAADAISISGAAYFFSLQNNGTITGPGTAAGVYLLPGGYVSNAASISGYPGIEFAGGIGFVVNAGSIAGTGTAGRGIVFTAGGVVTNGAAAAITAGAAGVAVQGGAGSVVNYGSIAGTGTSGNGGIGVQLTDGGSVTNAASAAITGVYRGVDMAADGTVVNYGSIAGLGTNRDGIALLAGGTVTNTTSAAITGGFVGVFIYGDDATVVNAGSIAATVFVTAAGIALFSDGVVTNQASGTITGVYCGINMGSPPSTGPGTVANYGSILGTGTASIGVRLLGGGTVANAAGASIGGIADGVYVKGGPVILNNAGSIVGTGTASLGVDLRAVAAVTNAAGGSIAGDAYGVRLAAGGTLTNAGTIGSSGGTSVMFEGTGGNLLELQPGFDFAGKVIGSSSASNTLALASAAVAGSVGGLGTQYLNFGPLVFDPGARWTVAGNTVGLGGTISGFTVGDTIELTGVTETGSSFSGAILTLDEAVGAATLDLAGTFSPHGFIVTTGAGNTEVTLSTACFHAGTRLLTVAGEVAVEALAPGDLVATLSGRLRPIRWIGHRRIDASRHPRPTQVWPICVQAHAFGRDLPHRDLWLSPDHAVYIGQVLMPIRTLLNGSTILRVETAAVSYWHVELDRHDIVLAEGLPAESYLDTGNRAAFANGGPVALAWPDFSPWVWEALSCAPLVVSGPLLAAAKARLIPPREAASKRPPAAKGQWPL